MDYLGNINNVSIFIIASVFSIEFFDGLTGITLNIFLSIVAFITIRKAILKEREKKRKRKKRGK